MRDDLRLGVVWYLNPREPSRGYLHDTKFRDRLDAEVYEALREIDARGERRLAAIEQAARRDGRVLPPTTCFYSEPVLPQDWARFRGSGRRARLLESRRRWLEGALRATGAADVVFVDPDNGLKDQAPRKDARTKVSAAVYAFLDELDPFLRRGQSVVVYQHQTRKGDVRAQAEQWLETLGRNWEPPSAWAVIFRLGQVRAYFILPAERHRAILQERVQRVAERWGRDVELIGLGETA